MIEKKIQNEDEKKFAGFWIRFLALILDGIVVNAVINIIYILIGRDRSFLSNPSAFATFSGNPELYLIQLTQWLYYILMIRYFGASLGKMALKIKVISRDSTELDWVSIILRETVGKFISGIILGIGYLMVAWDPKKQALHDKISGTVVVVEK